MYFVRCIVQIDRLEIGSVQKWSMGTYNVQSCDRAALQGHIMASRCKNQMSNSVFMVFFSKFICYIFWDCDKLVCNIFDRIKIDLDLIILKVWIVVYLNTNFIKVLFLMMFGLSPPYLPVHWSGAELSIYKTGFMQF